MAGTSNNEYKPDDEKNFYYRPPARPTIVATKALQKLYKEFKKDYSKDQKTSTPFNQNVNRKRQISPVSDSADQLWQHLRKTAKPNDRQDRHPMVQTKNKFNSLSENETDDMEAQDSSGINANISANIEQSKKIRPPTIFLLHSDLREVIKMLTDNEVSKSMFVIKQESEDEINIYSSEITVFEKIKVILANKNIKFYTHTPKNVKPINIILKGVKGGYTENDVLAELNETIPDLEIKKITKIIFNKNNPSVYHFLIQLPPNFNTRILYNIKFLANQKVKWEKLRKNKIFQCRNCQGVGHTSANCNLGYKCVKCANTHKYGECQIKDKTDKSKIYCVNCENYGHPASYRGCPFLKFSQQFLNACKQQRKNLNKKTVNNIVNYTSRNVSYAQALGNNGESHSTQHNEFGSGNVNSPIDDLKREIISAINRQFESIEKRIADNTRKINLIFNFLFEEPIDVVNKFRYQVITKLINFK